MDEAFQSHLSGGLTTLARAWAIARLDGMVLGFTDHDRDLVFDGITFRADSGLTATALHQTTGLSVDNAEAMGALRDARLNEADILAGRYDGAEVRLWLVNWAEPAQRALRFRGTLGEIRRAGGAFHAELRGVSEALNRPLGRVYQKPCAAVLGDASCGVDLGGAGYAASVPVLAVDEADLIVIAAQPGFEPGWFQHGRMIVETGAAAGLSAPIKRDEAKPQGRAITLWTGVGARLAPGDLIRLQAGCDKRFDTCRFKFDNALSYQGFPDIPAEDWLLAVPDSAAGLSGGSRR